MCWQRGNPCCSVSASPCSQMGIIDPSQSIAPYWTWVLKKMLNCNIFGSISLPGPFLLSWTCEIKWVYELLVCLSCSGASISSAQTVRICWHHAEAKLLIAGAYPYGEQGDRDSWPQPFERQITYDDFVLFLPTDQADALVMWVSLRGSLPLLRK